MLRIMLHAFRILATVAAHGQIFFYGQLTEYAPPFGNHHQAVAHEHIRRRAGYGFALVENIAARNGNQAADSPQRRAFTRAVGADQADELAPLDPQIYAAHSADAAIGDFELRSEEHTSELQSLMRISYAVFCLKK